MVKRDTEIIDGTEYTVWSEKTKDTQVYFSSMFEDIKGFMPGKSDDEVLEIYARISNCTCGGKPELHEFEGMGDGDYTIRCRDCGRDLRRSPYDVDIKCWDELLDACIRDWNNGLCSEDIERMNDAEHERVRIREEDLVWKKL